MIKQPQKINHKQNRMRLLRDILYMYSHMLRLRQSFSLAAIIFVVWINNYVT